MSFIKRIFGKKGESNDINVFDGEELGMLNAIQKAQESFASFEEEVKLESRRIVP